MALRAEAREATPAPPWPWNLVMFGEPCECPGFLCVGVAARCGVRGCVGVHWPVPSSVDLSTQWAPLPTTPHYQGDRASICKHPESIGVNWIPKRRAKSMCDSQREQCYPDHQPGVDVLPPFKLAQVWPKAYSNSPASARALAKSGRLRSESGQLAVKDQRCCAPPPLK